MTDATIVEYLHGESPTVAATAFVPALQAGEPIVNPLNSSEVLEVLGWGQGADPTPLVPELAKFMTGEVFASGVYGKAVKPLNQAGADYYKRMMGVDANAGNTLVGMNLGRGPLYTSATHYLRAGIHNAAVIMPDTSWPMVKDIYDGFIPLLYDASAPAEEIADFIAHSCSQTGPDAPVPVIVYTNYPHNPTGAQLTNWDPITKVIDAVNMDEGQLAVRTRTVACVERRRKLMLVCDNAYYHVAPMLTPVLSEANPHYMDLGYEKLNMKGPSPILVDISGSKALGTAEPGLFFAICSAELLAGLKKENTTIGFQQSGASNFFNNVSDGLAPANDPLWLDRNEERSANYSTNRQSTIDGGMGEWIIPGKANLVGVYGFSPEDILGKSIMVRGENFVTETIGHVVQALGNNTGTVVVDNGIHPTTGKALLRVAYPSSPVKFAPRVPIVAAQLKSIISAPRF